MDIDQVLPIQDVASFKAVNRLSERDQGDKEKIKQFARDFESVFINNLLDQMSTTVDSMDEDKDGAAKQIDGIFRMQLAQNLSDNGSLGLSKSIEQYVSHTLELSQGSQATEDHLL